MSMFGVLEMLDGETKRLFTPCHKCGHAHHCSREQCKECECTECDCDNCRAKKQQEFLEQNKHKRFV